MDTADESGLDSDMADTEADDGDSQDAFLQLGSLRGRDRALQAIRAAAAVRVARLRSVTHFESSWSVFADFERKGQRS